MNHLRSRILISFSKIVALSKIAHLLFVIISISHYSISIALCCASAIVYTFVACYTINYTFVDSFFPYVITFSSFASFCIVYASIKWCSLASSPFDSLMHTRSIDVTLGLVYSFACQCHLLLHKDSMIDVPIVFMFWIIVCTNYIFSSYAFLSAHSKDDDECNNDLITND
jgi:hypothetical protein